MVKVNNKTPERCHALFIFNFEYLQMNLYIFFNFEYVFVSWTLDKTHKTT